VVLTKMLLLGSVRLMKLAGLVFCKLHSASHRIEHLLSLS